LDCDFRIAIHHVHVCLTQTCGDCVKIVFTFCGMSVELLWHADRVQHSPHACAFRSVNEPSARPYARHGVLKSHYKQYIRLLLSTFSRAPFSHHIIESTDNICLELQIRCLCFAHGQKCIICHASMFFILCLTASVRTAGAKQQWI
jgi:hypothetical protein